VLSFLKNLIRWARITGPANNQENFSVQQVTYLGKTADSLIVFPYGHHANVSNDSLALMFSIASNPENRAAIAWTPNDRPDLEQNEIAIYHPFTNSLIHFKNSGDIDITGDANLNATVTGTATIDAPETTITGNVTINGNLQVDGVATLGSGGALIARLGDTVAVTVPGVMPGAATLPGTGTITSGSPGGHTAS
jgi:phage gp45-like